MRKPANQVIAPVLLDNPVLSHVDIMPKTRLLYQFYCINKLTLYFLWTSRPCEDCDNRIGKTQGCSSGGCCAIARGGIPIYSAL